jgi:crotonobetainyl-CoA:carnitine CoA-transferase CaiB-like acyl-CoA transferase
VVWDRGKKSLALDLESPKGIEVLFRLLERCDALLVALQPGEADRMQFSYDAVHRQVPHIIYCSLTGYDMHGPEKDRPFHDALVQARSGFMTNNWGIGAGEQQPGPKRMGFAAPSYAGAFYACFGMLTALYIRNETGNGQHINVSAHTAALSMSRWNRAEQQDSERPAGRGLFGVWICGDGEYQWTHTGARGAFDRYMTVFGLEEYMASAPEPMTWSTELNREVREKVTDIMKTRPRAEWVNLFNEADVPNHPVLYPGDAFKDEQARAVDMVATVDDPVLGRLEQVGVPIKFEKTPGNIAGPAPLKGQHTDAVLRDIGYSESEVAILRGDGIVA